MLLSWCLDARCIPSPPFVEELNAVEAEAKATDQALRHILQSCCAAGILYCLFRFSRHLWT